MTTMTITAHSSTTSDRVERLIAVLDRLGALLAEEIDAVRMRDYGRIGDLGEQKDRLAQSYRERMRDLREHASNADEVEPRLAARMRDSLKSFLGVVETNARALGAARTAHEKFIKGVSEAVAEKARPVKGYSSAGTYGAPTARPRADSLPIALNEMA
jgi:flagellar biosynthesis/type III secretory pathway chaperone